MARARRQVAAALRGSGSALSPVWHVGWRARVRCAGMLSAGGVHGAGGRRRCGWRCSGRCGWSWTASRWTCRAPSARGARAAGAGRGPDRPVDQLVDALWPAEVPESGRQALHTHVSRLRTHLGPAAARLQTRPAATGWSWTRRAGPDPGADAARRGPGRHEDPAGALALLRRGARAVARTGARRPHRRRADRRRGRGVRAAAPRGDRRPDRLRGRRRAGRRRSSARRRGRWPKIRCASPPCCS